MRPLVFAFRVRPYSVRPCTQRHRLAVGRLRAAADLLIHLHLDVRRTLAVLIVVVVPDLQYLDRGLRVLVGIINIVLGVRCIDRTRCNRTVDLRRHGILLICSVIGVLHEFTCCFVKREPGLEPCLIDGVLGSPGKVRETQRPTCLNLYGDLCPGRHMVVTGSRIIFDLRNAVGLQICHDPIGTIGRIPHIFFAGLVDLDRKLEQGVCGSALARDSLLDLQPAAAIVPCSQRSVSALDLILVAIDNVIICSLSSCRQIILYEHGGNTVDDHRVVDLAGQLPTITAFVLFNLNDLIIMPGFKDLVAILRRPYLAKGDKDIIPLPSRRRRHLDGIISVQIIPPVLCQDQLNTGRRILLVEYIVPDLLHTDRLGRQRHSFRNNILFNHVVYMSGRIGKRGIQMGICQQVIGSVIILPDAGRFQFVVRHGDEFVVQIGDGIVCLLAGPYGKLYGIDPVVFQFANFAEVPGNAVGLVISSSRRANFHDALDRPLPKLLLTVRRFNVVLKAARFAGGNIGADVGERRDTVIHGDVSCSHTGNDLSRDLAESSL